MTQQHPITPPQELRDKWLDEAPNTSVYDYLIDSAAQWGADQELEACCDWLHSSLPGYDKHYADYLRAARRPKPPRLKEQALEVLNEIESGKHGWLRISDNLTTIRRALESLPE